MFCSIPAVFHGIKTLVCGTVQRLNDSLLIGLNCPLIGFNCPLIGGNVLALCKVNES